MANHTKDQPRNEIGSFEKIFKELHEHGEGEIPTEEG